MTAQTTVTNETTGIPWTVRVVRQGDHYGRDDCLTHDEVEPLVEFYDLRFTKNFGPRGQFVSRYYLSTLLEHDDDLGLDLDGGVPAWYVTGANMREVRAWLATL